MAARTATAIASAWPTARGGNARHTARARPSCSPRATAKSQPMPGFTPCTAPRPASASHPVQCMAAPRSGVAEGVGRGVAALEPHLVWPEPVLELHEEAGIGGE